MTDLTTARTAPDSAGPPVRLRVAMADDADALTAFAARAFTGTYARGGSGVTATSRPEDVAAYVAERFTPERQRAELADVDLVTLVAEVPTMEVPTGGAAEWAGYAQLRRRPSAAAPTPSACAGAHPRELARLYVAPAWHGRGVAGMLMDAVQVRASAEPGGADPLWLAVAQANVRAVAFYRRCGFVVAGATTFTMGAECQDDWLMVWRG
ncbi:hypothetical protein tb265_18850 [Gemmatimonadetes bacterium T265]|nr:hypothetical protein tb265_18850 [Gemmatimonadetes bacterium T265]